jgi:hypothetical protein
MLEILLQVAFVALMCGLAYGLSLIISLLPIPDAVSGFLGVIIPIALALFIVGIISGTISFKKKK